MCTDYVEEKRDLIRAILTERKLSNLPKISQVTNSPLIAYVYLQLFNWNRLITISVFSS